MSGRLRDPFREIKASYVPSEKIAGEPQDPVGGDLERGPAANDWPAWTGFVALVAALVLANLGALIVDIPAVVAGVKVGSSPMPHGLVLADTFVQDVMFVVTVVLFAGLGGRAVRSWRFGLRPTPARRAAGLVVLTILAFLFFSLVWEVALNESTKEKLLEQLGANETVLLLVLSALLTTVIAPICEEMLFRGYIFGALSKWRGWLPGAAITGILFGAVHVGSAPVVDLVPLAGLGFFLCVLYRRTGSLYPCIATHSLNNSLAFVSLEGWRWWAAPLLMAGSLGAIWLIWLLARRLGAISPVTANPAVTASAYDHR
jgi:membrane protease YdiL (CAAX protease family)